MIWSNRAIADLNRLRKFLKVKDSEAGRRAVATIRARVQILDQYPQIGRPAAFSGRNLREWPIRFGSSGYVVRYQAEDGQVTILAVMRKLIVTANALLKVNRLWVETMA